ncbi:MAG: helix-turn-helix domain-containing protein [Cytophagales bacterium]|nr:helix-turn-helix domain-containing protein [Cytophagales bacterium]MCA6388685.1 helix-turn-helix domain-containing protein [Cytophagales bacterium]MCA6392697.1 helix-turn-helix domain-containing protein [Cytophagales bacterium]MCA6395296.1 helix-turn-helix domain-containing protein [Cytophagales bacterium]MCA6400362.1 helix-turn-helix domain-containing protein [Cytophagales bacterium]
MNTETNTQSTIRQLEIVRDYLSQLDTHIADLKKGLAAKTFEINEFADLLHIHPTHLSNTLSLVLGQSPCDLYEQRLVKVAKELLRETNLPIGDIARQLFYDPSNFTKFFNPNFAAKCEIWVK